jgi:hypothetical protein
VNVRCRPGAAVVDGLRTNAVAATASGSWTIHKWRWHVLLFGALGAAWDDAMVARWSANPLGMLWPEMDAVLIASGSGGGPLATPPGRWSSFGS